LLTTWLVLPETCHVIPESTVPGFMQWVARGYRNERGKALRNVLDTPPVARGRRRPSG